MTILSDLSEGDKHQAEKELKELQEKVTGMISKTNNTVKSLREAADKLDDVWKDCKIAHVMLPELGLEYWEGF